MASIRVMNRSLYNAAFHLKEASKHLSDVEEFRPEAIKLMKMAYEMACIIEPETPKVEEDKMRSILDEIMKHGATE